MSHLSEIITKFQKEKGYRSVRAIANASGVPVSTLYDVLKERTVSLSVENSQKLANFMGVSVDELYGEKEKTLDAVAPRDEKYNEIFRLLDALSEQKLEEAVRYLKFLAEN